MTNKIVITKTGFNALTETNPDNMIYSSDYDTLKYDVVADVNLNFDYANYYFADTSGFFDVYYFRFETTYTHGLGYIPNFTSYLKDFPNSGEGVQLPVRYADFQTALTVQSFADATKIYFVFQGRHPLNSGTGTLPLVVRVFKNDLGL